jgi:hypothetical protein
VVSTRPALPGGSTTVREVGVTSSPNSRAEGLQWRAGQVIPLIPTFSHHRGRRLSWADGLLYHLRFWLQPSQDAAAKTLSLRTGEGLGEGEFSPGKPVTAAGVVANAYAGRVARRRRAYRDHALQDVVSTRPP